MRPGWFPALVCLVSLTASLAGCAGDSPPAEASADSASETGREGRPPAGLVGENVTLDPVDVAWDGALPVRLCAPSGPNSCMGASAPSTTGGEDDLFVAAEPATWSGQIVLTWAASSPATESLSLWFGFYEKCGASCWQGVGSGAYTSGPSPLTLDLADVEAPAKAEGLWISVHEPRLTPDPVYAIASMGQEFHAEGRLVPSATRPA